MKLRPIGNRVVLKAIEKNKSVNGIIIPDTVSEKPTYFEVLAVGEGFYIEQGKLVPITNMKVGDIVLLPKHSGIDIKDEETQEVIRIVGATQVLGVIEQ